jgi:hypothetical protein
MPPARRPTASPKRARSTAASPKRTRKTPSKAKSSPPPSARAAARFSPSATAAEEGGASSCAAGADEEEDKLGKAAQTGLQGDWGAIGLLMLLYTLQGIPMGLSGSVPFLMQAKGISMTEQAKFSIVSWPFSLKLLWAPLVDSLYSGKVGRRKTWIVPAQMSIGFLLLFAGSHIDVAAPRLAPARILVSLPCSVVVAVRSLVEPRFAPSRVHRAGSARAAPFPTSTPSRSSSSSSTSSRPRRSAARPT